LARGDGIAGDRGCRLQNARRTKGTDPLLLPVFPGDAQEAGWQLVSDCLGYHHRQEIGGNIERFHHQYWARSFS
jgi:hypothetical protein